MFAEHAGEIFWLNLNGKGELWLNAKASKYPDGDVRRASGAAAPARRRTSAAAAEPRADAAAPESAEPAATRRSRPPAAWVKVRRQ